MMTSEFEGKVALVTGSSSGIGSAVATRLSRGGATVAVHYNSHKENAAAVASAITSPAARRSSSVAMWPKSMTRKAS